MDGGKPILYPFRHWRINNGDHYPLALSAISIWEVAKKVSLGKLGLSIPIQEWMNRAANEKFIRLLPLSIAISLESTCLPGTFHKDPADQIIVATARVNNLTLLTSDQKIRAYPHVKTV